jgi:hypothetical protein
VVSLEPHGGTPARRIKSPLRQVGMLVVSYVSIHRPFYGTLLWTADGYVRGARPTPVPPVTFGQSIKYRQVTPITTT